MGARGFILLRLGFFGFAIPGEEGKFFYNWFDAPIGYLASLGDKLAPHGNAGFSGAVQETLESTIGFNPRSCQS